MSTIVPVPRSVAAASNAGVTRAPSASVFLQRKCACGSSTASVSDKCDDCQGKTLQRKLAVGSSNDALELEADRIADQVMSRSGPARIAAAPLRIQRFSGRTSGDVGTAPASVDGVLNSAGRPMEPALRSDMEQRFGHDFSRVRIHTGGAAEQSARDVSARAYTVGSNVVFGAGGFAPETREGQRLLAHELTHVVQQGQQLSDVGSRVQRVPGANPDPAVLEDGVRDRVKDWRMAADQGIQIFVNQELSASIRQKSLDTRGFSLALIGNLVWAAACFTPVGATAALTTFAVSAVGIGVATYGSVSPDRSKPGPDPIVGTQNAMLWCVDQIQQRSYEVIRGWVTETLQKFPDASRDAVIGHVMQRLFRGEFLKQRSGGGPSEIDFGAVRASFTRSATSLLHRFEDQVQPIGEKRFGHRQVVAIARPGGEYVLVARRVEDGFYRYEFLNHIDPDLEAGARARMESEVDEGATTVVSQPIEGMWIDDD